MNRTIIALVFSALGSQLTAADPQRLPTIPGTSAETERAFAQERAADVVALYSDADRIILYRPERKEQFTTETAFLDYLKSRKEPKRLLVVILGKAHEFTDSKQTTDGFWQACRNTGFDRVVIQQAHSSMRPILRE